MKECPNCKKTTFSNFDNILIGPTRSKNCSSCGAKISTPYKTMWLSATVIIIMLLFAYFIEMPSSLVLMTITAVLYTLFGWKYIPLIVKEK